MKTNTETTSDIDIIADEIKKLSAGINKILNGKLTKRALICLIQDSKIAVMKGLLDQCTGDQVAFFHRIWPSGIPPEDKLDSALALIKRTIIANERKESK